MRKEVRIPSSNLDSLKSGSPLTPQEFVDKYPYLLRYCRGSQFQNGKFVLEPQTGENVSYGVFFYPLEDDDKVKDVGGTKLVVRTKDLIGKVGSVLETVRKGVIVMPSQFFEQVSEDLVNKEMKNGSTQMKASYNAYEKIYKEWAVLNEAKISVGLEPVLSIPAKMEVGREYLVRKY